MSFEIRKTPYIVEYTAEEVTKLLPLYSKEDKVLIVDGDIIAFKVSSVCEFKYLFKHKENGDTFKAKSKKEFKNFLEEEDGELGTIEDYDCEFRQEAEPFSYCAKTLKDALENIMEATECNKLEIYIGGSNNFRSFLPLYPQYKTNRSNQPRPLLLTQAKEYLINVKGAFKIKGSEADDVVQMRVKQLYEQGIKSVVYSNDKDLLQNITYNLSNYNPDSGVISEYPKGVSGLTMKGSSLKGCGVKWLLAQTMLGDDTDGYSPKKFFKKKYADKSYYNDFNEIVDHKEFVEKWILKWKDLVGDKIFVSDYEGFETEHDWLSLAELYYSCAKMVDGDFPTLKDLFKYYGVDYVL